MIVFNGASAYSSSTSPALFFIIPQESNQSAIVCSCWASGFFTNGVKVAVSMVNHADVFANECQ
jgi:hypothetical protein